MTVLRLTIYLVTARVCALPAPARPAGDANDVVRTEKRMKRFASIATLVVLATPAVAQEVNREHPNLSASLREFIDTVDEQAACELPADMTVEIESLLEWRFDAVTVQAEADELLGVYVKCVSSDRTAPFLVEALASSESPLVRVYLLRGLAATGHRVAVDVLVEHAANNEVYLTLESTRGGDETRSTIGDAASRLLTGLFPDVDASSPEGWSNWWAKARDRFTRVRGLPYQAHTLDGSGL